MGYEECRKLLCVGCRCREGAPLLPFFLFVGGGVNTTVKTKARKMVGRNSEVCFEFLGFSRVAKIFPAFIIIIIIGIKMRPPHSPLFVCV